MSNIISIILIAVSIGTFFMYVDPTYTDIKSSQVEAAGFSRALDNSKKLQAEKQVLLDKYNSISAEDLDKITKLLPDNIDNVRLIIDVNEMAKQQGVSIGAFKAEVTPENSKVIGAAKSSYGTLSLSFSVSANYNMFLSFMKKLENSLRILDVTSIQFSAGDTSSVYDYNVTIKTYWLK